MIWYPRCGRLLAAQVHVSGVQAVEHAGAGGQQCGPSRLTSSVSEKTP